MNDSQTPVIRIRRDRNSSWWVRVSDRVAKQVITVGGVGTIIVVMLVVLVLLSNVIPLFRSNSVKYLASIPLGASAESNPDNSSGDGRQPDPIEPIACGVDEYSELLWVLTARGTLSVYSIATGKQLSSHHASDDSGARNRSIVCCAVADNDASMLAGYSDGTVRPITFQILAEFVSPSDLPTDLVLTEEMGATAHDGTLYRLMKSGLVRKQQISDVVFHPAIRISDKPITQVDWRNPQVASSFDDSQTWTWGATDGESIALGVVENKVNSFSGAVSQDSKTWTKSPSEPDRSAEWIGLMIGSRSEQIQSLDRKGNVVVWVPSGDKELVSSMRYRSLAGTESVPNSGVPLLGRSTWMIGSESGHLEGLR